MTVPMSTSTPRGNKPIVDVKDFLSDLCSRREVSPTRALVPLSMLPGMISLGTGLPNPECFPFTSLSFSLSSGEMVTLTQDELKAALQYSATPGMPALLKELHAMQIREHDPKYDISEFAVSVTTGSQDALSKAFEMFINPGDEFLVENPTYSGALAFLRPLQPKLVGVNVDSDGIDPAHLRELLEERVREGKPTPRALYTIPTGQNPSGCSTSTSRKHEIYALAQKYNFVILEDDPYYYLQFGRAPLDMSPEGVAAYEAPKQESYMSMDVDGRVLRFDSFSKVLSSGMRVGFVSGPKSFVHQLDLTSQATNIHSSGIPQAMVAKLMQTWGQAGWDKHVRDTKLFYLKRRDFYLAKVEEHLAGLVRYTIPDAGMFVWFEVLGLDTTAKDLIEKKAVNAKVLMLPGEAFLIGKPQGVFVRSCFSTATDDQIDEALHRFGELIRAERAEQVKRAE